MSEMQQPRPDESNPDHRSPLKAHAPRLIHEDGARIEILGLDRDWYLDGKDRFQVNQNIPNGFMFESERDSELARRLPYESYLEVTKNMPTPTCDVFLVSQDKNGNLSVLTIVRDRWPLKGFEWMLGGRQSMPPADHPLAESWDEYHDALLVSFNEAGVQPAQIQDITYLAHGMYSFERVREDQSSYTVERRRTPSFTCVARLAGTSRPKISLDFQSSSPRWVTKQELQHPNRRAQFCLPMQKCLDAIFDAESLL